MKIRNWIAPLMISVVILGLASFAIRERHAAIPGSAEASKGMVRFLTALENGWYDYKFRLRPPETTSDVFVARIDDASLERFGRWPWPRAVYNQILYYLHDLGAEVVAFDAVFSEPEFQERYVKEALTKQVEGRPSALKEEAKLNDEQIDILAGALPHIGVQIFGAAIRDLPKTVLGYIWQRGAECPLYDPLNPAHVEEAEKAGYKVDELKTREGAAHWGLLHVDALVDSLSQLNTQAIKVDGFPPLAPDRAQTAAEVFDCPIVNRAEINAYAKHMGFFNAIADGDGLFRRSMLVAGFRSSFVPEGQRDFLEESWFSKATFFPSLAVEAVAALWDSPVKIELENGVWGEAVKAIVFDRKEGPLRIPTLPDGTLPVNFYGTQQSNLSPIPEFSLARVEADLANPKLKDRISDKPGKPLDGKVVLIGPTAIGVYDLRPTPVQGDGAGVFIHAATIARILERAHDPQSRVSVRFADFGTSLAILWGVGLALAILLIAARALQGAAGVVVALGAFMAVDYHVFATRMITLETMTTVLALVAIFLGVFAYKYFTEEKDRAFVKGAFEKYVSPDVVDSIIKDPRQLNLGGQKKELTVLFSDIRGFTTISERMGAAELAKFMNDYLSPMTDLVLENKGTIDKYMGDAIMAIFGAPIEYVGHAEKAVDAALAMMTKLEELKIGWAALDLPKIDIGIGINTGDMSVGNMGSARIFSYTVMGDSVNLGSRLEGLNKEYATHVIVSEFTRAHLGENYLCRELDRVKVKGKLQPVTIFEVQGRDGDPEKKARIQEFEAALKLYYAQEFQAAREAFETLSDLDPTSRVYAERCETWMQEPPATDWDGTWTMKSK